ncbi:EF-hand domain-containing protein [Insolitispirillum peregrinum]|uniref:EF-hand domain-containing protein n=1 Tax=Insolitispirillum peregrinum TaxID=80876 RepID=UPI00361CFB00
MKFSHPFVISAIAAMVAITAVGSAHAMPNGGPDGGPDAPMVMMGGHGEGRLLMLDSNKDGVISKDEFLAPQVKRFSDIDTNKDGQISLDEWQVAKPAMDRMARRMDVWLASASQAERDLMTAHKAAEFRALDINSDGAVTKDEFLTMPTLRFAAMDSNQDGVLDVEMGQGPMMGRGDHHGKDACEPGKGKDKGDDCAPSKKPEKGNGK